MLICFRVLEMLFSSCSRTYAQDGASIMGIDALIDFLVRAQYFQMIDMLRQTGLNFSIDPEGFRQCVRLNVEGNNLVSNAWETAPLGYEVSSFGTGTYRT